MIYRNKIAGFNLIEAMLGIFIFISITLLVLNQYRQATKDNSFAQINYTVDTLFQGMANYYSAYCRNPLSSTGYVISNPNKQSLDPRDTSSDPVNNNPFVVVKSGQNWLQSNKFIATSNWPPPILPEVDTTVGDHGYITQFNLTAPTSAAPARAPTAIYNSAILTGVPTTTYMGWVDTTSGVTKSTPVAPLPWNNTGVNGVGQIYYWRAQVAVKMIGTLAVVNAYAKRLGADCTSTLSGGAVSPCSAGTPGNYVVWERSPSFGSANTRTPMWLTTRRIKQSTQQYTNDDMYGTTDLDWARGTGWTGGAVIGQGGNLYLCGG